MLHVGTTIRPGENINFSLDEKGEMYINATSEGGGSGGIRKIQTVIPILDVATLDLSIASLQKGNIFKVSSNDNLTMAVINATPDADTLKEFELHVVMGATAYAVTWFASIAWLECIPQFSANKTGACVFRTVDGINFIGNLAYEY